MMYLFLIIIVVALVGFILKYLLDRKRRKNMPEEGSKFSASWYLMPLFLGFIGGLLAWLVTRNRYPKEARILLITGIIITIVVILVRIFIVS